MKHFLKLTQADELIAVTHMYHAIDRIRSYELFSEVMKELNSESAMY